LSWGSSYGFRASFSSSKYFPDLGGSQSSHMALGLVLSFFGVGSCFLCRPASRSGVGFRWSPQSVYLLHAERPDARYSSIRPAARSANSRQTQAARVSSFIVLGGTLDLRAARSARFITVGAERLALEQIRAKSPANFAHGFLIKPDCLFRFPVHFPQVSCAARAQPNETIF